MDLQPGSFANIRKIVQNFVAMLEKEIIAIRLVTFDGKDNFSLQNQITYRLKVFSTYHEKPRLLLVGDYLGFGVKRILIQYLPSWA